MAWSRTNGFQSPLDGNQIGCYVLFLFLLAGVGAFHAPGTEGPALRGILLGVYLGLAFTGLALLIVTSAINPSDPGLFAPSDGEFYCSVCQANVGPRSKHCRTCNRCVEDFDHHCKWLNNCVGRRNYRQFLALVTFAVLALGVQTGWGLWLFVRSFTQRAAAAGLVQAAYGGRVSLVGWRVAIAVWTLLCAVSIFLLIELCVFHCILIYKGLSTYEYITRQRERRADAAAAAAAAAAEAGVLHPEPRCACLSPRRGRVADEAALRSAALHAKPRVGINPLAALMMPRDSGAAGGKGSYAASDKGKQPAGVAAAPGGQAADATAQLLTSTSLVHGGSIAP